MSSRIVIVLLLIVVLAGLPLDSRAAPPTYPGISADELDRYLRGKGSPIAGQGTTLLEAGQTYDVDPRLIVAISGAESTFGKYMCASYNAWGMMYWPNGQRTCRPFNSWAEAIYTVAWELGAGQYYLNGGRTTIEAIGRTYCGAGCDGWIDLVTLFYTEQGGDLGNLRLSGSGSGGSPGGGGSGITPPDSYTPPPADGPPDVTTLGRLYWSMPVSGCAASTDYKAYYFEVWNTGRDIWFDFDVIQGNLDVDLSAYNRWYDAMPRGTGYTLLIAPRDSTYGCYTLAIHSDNEGDGPGPNITPGDRLYWGQPVSGCVTPTAFDSYYFEVWDTGRTIWFDTAVTSGDLQLDLRAYNHWYDARPRGQGYTIVVHPLGDTNGCYSLAIHSDNEGD